MRNIQLNIPYFKNIVVGVTTVAFCLTSIPVYAAPPLAPLSLGQMYSLASQGNVRALRGAVQRGLNINITDRNGNTGLCHSIWKKDYTAYNAFQASGANPRHPCIQRIPTEKYDSFMSSWRVSDVNATPRDAYRYFNEGEFVISDSTYWIGGALLIGGIAALSLGGGGGGSDSVYRDIYTPTDYSLGAYVGTLKPANPQSVPYVAVKYDVQIGETKINNADFGLSNDSTINVKNPDTGAEETKPLSDLINFNKSVLENSKYIQVGMKASNGGFIQNGESPLVGTDDGTVISLGDATAGMVALHNSQAKNENTIRINSKNAAIGMIASDKSTISNNGKIDITFTGSAATNQINGMYADTSSTAINNGKIEGAAISEKGGALIGMQARIINQEASPNPAMSTKLINATNGSITLQATANEGITTSKTLVGMGSYLEQAFLDGTQLIRRAGFVDMFNQGDINIDLNLNGSGAYATDSGTLLNGTGGFIGMRADANSTANNDGNIRVNIHPANASAIINAIAGMQSVRGGSIANSNNIEVTGGSGGYGMLGIRGEGNNPEIDSRKPVITNATNATITVDSLDGFGMATYHGGNLSNAGNIILDSKGTGMHINDGVASNSGTISLTNSGQGMVIKRNTGATEGATYNASKARITNTSNIAIAKSDGAQGMYIEDGLAQNDGAITVGNTENTATQSSYGIQALNGTVINNGAINMNVLTTTVDSYGIHTTNAKASNNAGGSITFAQKGIGMHTGSGSNTNNGTITMNSGGTGMSSETGAINNNLDGQIILNDNGTGISSTTGQINNLGTVTISGRNSNPSIGLKSGSKIINTGTVNMNGSNLTGIEIGENGKVLNVGNINITTNASSVDNYGIKGTSGTDTRIENTGSVTITGHGYDTNVEQAYGISIADGEAYNKGDIIFNEIYGYGMNATAAGVLRNYKTINLTKGGVGIQGESGATFNERGATISVSGTPTGINSYGMKMTGLGSAWNDGIINVAGKGQSGDINVAYGIYVNGGNGVNNNIINMTANNSYGMFDAVAGALNNKTGAIINISGNDSVGMESSSGKSNNEGTINVGIDNAGVITGGNNSYGIKAGSGASASNSGIININGNNSYGMFTDAGTITNELYGVINIIGKNNTAFKTKNNGSAINYGLITYTGDNIVLSDISEGGSFVNNGTVSTTGTGNKVVEIGQDGSFENDGNIIINGDSSYGIYINGNGKSTNNNYIVVNGTNSYGMYAVDDGILTNNAKGIIDVIGVGSSGLGAKKDLSIINNDGTINLKGDSTSGINLIAAEENGSATNKGKIIITADNAVGMKANGGTLINDKIGQISIISGNNSRGMQGTATTIFGSKIINNGNISSNNTSTADGIRVLLDDAITTDTSIINTVNNFGTINLKNSGNGIYAERANVTNESNSSILLENGGIGINATKGNDLNVIMNKGTIQVGSDANSDITASGIVVAAGYGVINDKDANITVFGKDSIGISSTSSSITNSGTITANGLNSIGIISSTGDISNAATGKINVTGTNGKGIVSNGTIFTNDGLINVIGTSAIAMETATSLTMINNKDIVLSGAYSTGMNVVGIGKANNVGNIKVDGDYSKGMDTNDTDGIASNSGNIEVSGFNASGMYATNGIAINEAAANIKLNKSNSFGMSASSVGDVTNNGTIADIATGSNNHLMHTASGGSAINNGTLKVNGDNSIGMYANGGAIINGINGKIERNNINYSLNPYLMYVKSGAGINSGILSDNYSDFSLIAMDTGTISNSGTLNVGNAGSASTNMSGILVRDGDATNSSTGIINVNAKNSFGMQALGGTATNKGTIAVSGDNSVAMYANGNGTIINEQQGILTDNQVNYASMPALMYVDGNGKAINVGSIYINKSNFSAMYSNSAMGHITNSGRIVINQNSAIGLNAIAGTISNNSNIESLGSNNKAIKGSGTNTTIINNNHIDMTGENNIGIEATDSATAYNALSAKILMSYKSAIGMKATDSATINNLGNISLTRGGIGISGSDDSIIKNDGTIEVEGFAGDNYGIYMKGSANSKATNNGTIKIVNVPQNNSSYGMYMDGNGSILNNTDGVINIFGANNLNDKIYGMYVKDQGNATNEGLIDISKSSSSTGTPENSAVYGMYLDGDGTIFNSNSGTIKMYTDNIGFGMYVKGGGTATNIGAINVYSYASASPAYGMYLSGTGNIINDINGTILLARFMGSAMHVSGTGTATNNGNINATRSGYGMYSESGGNLINNGNIDVLTLYSFSAGMYVKGGGTATNNGNIRVTDNNIGEFKAHGMYAEAGGKLINNGTINMAGATGDVTGMYATGSGSSISNNGTIIIKNIALDDSVICNPLTGCGNYIKVANGATFTNGGVMVSNRAMNFASFNDDGTGSVIIGKGGSFEAPEISGDIKASSDIVMGSQKDEYVNSNSFVGDDKGIEIASGSYMFDAAIKTNDKGNMDVVMTRKEFSSIMENQKIASYLENNYSISHSIFDALKIAGSANGFASVTNESLGLNLIPSFAKQNLDVIKSLNRQVNQAIFNNDEEKPMRAMVGYDFFNREQDGTNVLSGYKDEASSAYGLFDKKYDNNLRYGFGLSVSKYESDYDNGSTRDEFVTQALGLLSYENNDFRFISAPRLGVGFGDYTRATVDGRYEADTLNYYYGVTNEARKDIDMGAFTLEPVAEFNILGVYQNRTKEDGQLIVESSNNLSVETGLGLYAKKEFEITEKDIIKLRAGGTYYHELNNPYQAAKARVDGLNGSYHMDSYDTQRDRGVLSTRIDYKHEEFDFYAEANKYLEEDAGYSLNAGIGYRF